MQRLAVDESAIHIPSDGPERSHAGVSLRANRQRRARESRSCFSRIPGVCGAIAPERWFFGSSFTFCGTRAMLHVGWGVSVGAQDADEKARDDGLCIFR